MSDPLQPPFTQNEGPQRDLHYDRQGQAWLRDARTGEWSMLPSVPSFLTSQPHMQLAPSAGPPSTQASTSAHPLDPRLFPLPANDDLDLSDGPSIAEARGLKRANKVGGARRKEKKKKRVHVSDTDDSSADEVEPPKKKRQGRTAGVPNFSSEETHKLLDLVEKKLPSGAKGWKAVARSYAKWAKGNKHPERDVKSLETRFKYLLAKKKPTGAGECRPEFKRAHRVSDLIDGHTGTREISDSDDDSDSSVVVEDLGSSSKVVTAVAQRAPSPPLRRSRTSAPDLVKQLAKTFDPDAQRARDKERAERSFQTTQFFALSQQMRDAQSTIDSLRTQLHESERARDRAEFKLDMMGDREPRVYARPSGTKGAGRSKSRCEIIYPEGGACTYWVTDVSDDESDKENKAPPFPPFYNNISSGFGPSSSSAEEINTSFSTSGPSSEGPSSEGPSME